MLKIINLEFKNILKNIDIEVRDNEIVSIIAANNVGKTLLCNIVNTTIKTTSNIFLNDYEINLNKHNYLRRISFIPESFFFINDLVYQEIKMPLYNLNLNIKEINEKYEEVIVIILDNAIKYSDKNTTIKIYSKNSKIFIEDEGIGIKEKDLKYIFDRFYRADKSHSTEGYGLGLSLAKHLTEKMKLKISAYNNKEKGSTFVIE